MTALEIQLLKELEESNENTRQIVEDNNKLVESFYQALKENEKVNKELLKQLATMQESLNKLPKK